MRDIAPVQARPLGEEPRRRELMTAVGEGRRTELAPGVLFEELVGECNAALGLCTGILTVAVGGRCDFSLPPRHVALTPLSGTATVVDQGNQHELSLLDCLCISAGLPTQLTNASGEGAAVLHIASAAADTTPAATAVHAATTQIRRHAETPWFELGPGTRFQDYFNRQLGFPWLSGGYGSFATGARLPCHLHDFDESITIVSGTATCVVEGRRYCLRENATALVPRGRCHYFMNEGTSPMAMIWVYAGPMPERTVLAEHCCAGNPWA